MTSPRWNGVRRLGHHPGATGHALDPAGNENIAVVGLDGSSSLVDRLQSGPAQTIYGGAGNRIGQPSEKRRVARDIAGILARLVCTAEVDVFDFFFVDSGLVDQFSNNISAQVVGSNVFQNSAVATHRGAQGFNNDCFLHGFT